MELVKIKLGLILFFIVIINTFSFKIKSKINQEVKDIYDDSEYGDELEAISAMQAKLDYSKKKKTKQVNMFSDIDSKIPLLEIPLNAANFMKDNIDVNKSYIRLNTIANMKGGKEALKKDMALKGILTVVLMDPSKSHNCRTKAAKLATRIWDIPTTYQMTDPDQKKNPKNVDSYIAVPRVKRIYRPDYYVENYKAGNWEP